VRFCRATQIKVDVRFRGHDVSSSTRRGTGEKTMTIHNGTTNGLRYSGTDARRAK
jgi:hypothetical protein